MDSPNCNPDHPLIRKLSDVNFSLARERGIHVRVVHRQLEGLVVH